MMPPLKKAPPSGRTPEQLYNHYLVEKELADQLKAANKEHRPLIFERMYKELFEKVPDHPRLTRRTSDALTQKMNAEQMRLLRSHLNSDSVFLEFAPGDCRFAYKVAQTVSQAYGVDISDQRNPGDKAPHNFDLIIYDGYKLDQVASTSIDVVFSDQLIEHFHPEDTAPHFRIVYRILKDGGKYVFRTPHAQSGPHDISMYFSDKAEGFHLKEWTYSELANLVKKAGFGKFEARWAFKGINVRLPLSYFKVTEYLLDFLPPAIKRKCSRYLIPTLYAVIIK